MRLKKVLVELKIEKKINKKHGVYLEEIEEAMLEGKPIFFRAKGGKYIAIALKERYITIVFSYRKGIANVRTAYPSSDWQIRLYKRRRLRK